MVVSDRPPKNGFVAAARKVYNPVGFAKGYNFILWFIFDGALLGFVLSRFEYLNFDGVFCSPTPNANNHAGPGECYWYKSFRRNNIGIILHLATILPAGLLAVFQFVPIIRHKVILYHRIAGYVIILLSLVSNGSAIAVANHALGGDGSVRILVGILAILTTGSMALAIYNIKKLQIDQHRAWMLRAWFYFGSIVTLRIIQVLMSIVSAGWGDATLHVAMECAEVLSIFNGDTERAYGLYPGCQPNATAFTDGGFVPVTANFKSPNNPAEIGAALDSWFGAAGMLALVLHAVGVELYLHLTPRESQRLRQVSYERQLERDMKNAGCAGLVPDRIGDSDPWVPSAEKTGRSSSGGGSQERFMSGTSVELGATRAYAYTEERR